jgi:hypothetical protein
MSDEGLKYPEWQGLLRDAILEFGPQELSTKVQKVETAIFERMQALSGDSDHHNERVALADALATLRILKNEKLGFPDW